MAILGFAYYGAARIGLFWASYKGGAAPVWSAAGVAYLGLLLLGSWAWPAVALGGVAALLATGLPVDLAMALSLGNAVAAVVAVNVGRIGSREISGPASSRDLLRLFSAMAAGSGVAATIGTLALKGSEPFDLSSWFTVWRTWWIGDAIGMLSLVPSALWLGFNRPLRSIPRLSSRSLFAALLSLLALLLGLWLAHVTLSFFYVIPALAMSAILVQRAGAALAGFVASAGMLLIVLQAPDPSGALLFEGQIFVVIALGTTFLLATVLHERDKTIELREAEAEAVASAERWREAETRMRQVMSGAQAGYWHMSLETQVSRWDSGYRDLYGFQLDDEPSFVNWRTRIHPVDLPRLEANIQTAIEGGPTTWAQDFRIIHPTRGVRWIHDRVELIRDDAGRPVSIGGLNFDITERRQAEEEARGAEAALVESEMRFRNLADHSPAIMWITNPEGRSTYLNARWFEVTGQTEKDIEDFGWLNVIHPEDRPSCEQLFADAQEHKIPFSVELRIRSKEGGWRWMLDAAAPRWDADGRFCGFVGSMIDITDRKAAEEALAKSEQRFRNMADHAPVMMWVTDASGDSIYHSQLWQDFTGQTSKEASGFGWLEAIHPDDRAEANRTFLEANARKSPIRVEYRLRRADGAWRWVIDAAAPRLEPSGEFQGYIGSVIDITDRKEVEEALEQSRQQAEHAARHDELTGLANRPWFRRGLNRHLVARAEEELTALLFLDLDGFKSVNDSFGHPKGDELLVQASLRLQSCLRNTDLIARFGGDEFAILPNDATREADIVSLAERIIGCLSEPYLLEGREVVIGVSIGIAVAPTSGTDSDDLLKKADIALYRAKADGRGVYRFFEPAMEDAAKESQALRADLREALGRGEFLIHYQPIVDFEPMRVIGFEALLRWRHPQKGLLSPPEFIALAEETGAIEQIGAWVLREACSKAAGWPEDVFVSINLSARQFKGGGLVAAVSDALQASRLGPKRLQLEITESLLLQDGETVRGALSALRAWGIRISIDDFGTGYSSLGYLRTFSVDNIKIDKSFVDDLQENSRTSAILEAVMALADQLGASVTAEGIETEAQALRLQALGCRHGQGYLFSRPVPFGKVEWLICRSRAARTAETAEG